MIYVLISMAAILASCVDSQPESDFVQQALPASCPGNLGIPSSCTGPGFCSTQVLFKGDTFVHGLPKYQSYRVPSIIRGENGRLIAIAEARRYSLADSGDIDLVYRTSDDDGACWGPIKRLCDKGENTCGNPTALYDTSTKTVWVMLNYNDGSKVQFPEPGEEPIGPGDRQVYVTSYHHDSDSFSEPTPITAQVQPPGMVWDAVGPGLGVQLSHGDNAGRLVFPAIGRHIYSDDHGETWTYGMEPPPGTSEATLTELNDGALLRNDRAVTTALKCTFRRPLSVSEDGGQSWTAWNQDNSLLAPGHYNRDTGCPTRATGINRSHASSRRYTEGTILNRIMFSNPASTVKRRYMTVRISYDEGETYPISRRLHSGATGYSTLTKTADHRTGVLFEVSDKERGTMDIVFKKVSLSWILNGRSEPIYIGGNGWLGHYPIHDAEHHNYWSPETGWIHAPFATARSSATWVYLHNYRDWFLTQKNDPGVFSNSTSTLSLW